ncbi:bifunctional 3-(3-hydroxy-phenyl)propionate/3-hydroxycinnamic acid hydroxylase [Nocardia puris]|uniref:bifunctional 3-(3-hydroxy-phenyl)propionate/3-hydroxycinnamic acid hydroxylase MhpA n=1 Tax=Nocardia puris TaxID=208602 RepID=UPI001894F3A3|nr:bifunctional 3-(3-hydroxy-phenyl)propionate/3-hydroxycinnamic acid hydroxylase [Nocardia puris]MBF6213986.1 bifunctional 3-(3-hydroxy-phenyl)propionate/3-hydroxycinnamic acid hydroxylase [Nocardia puris]MBF6368718.1 bifunctional 3-(3-hydroxy-phenyl)propionate/3-hydroxycinnamic acid hydroxylase [Nocardia puris]MBF6461633.1 bifunctional 3-(3-hydroxy-phenyl)propionate/3-hydroxycinnamic acid hydroxylase [Nocardia puris]
MSGERGRIEHYPVVIVGAGPTGMTAALLLARYGIECLILDRRDEVYPRPRAVHLDDEVYRILADLGLGDEFAGISRPGLGLRLVDATIATFAEFRRDPDRMRHGFPQANMFDQPDLERLLRSRLEATEGVRIRGGCEVLDVANLRDRVRVLFRDAETDERHAVTADFVLGCDGANSVVRASMGSRMRDLGFAQRWLVVDIATGADLGRWEGVHQVCDPERAATYMRIGASRYRWEFRLRDNESADQYATLDTLEPLVSPWLRGVRDPELTLIRSAEYTFCARVVDRWRDRRIFLLGDAAHLTPPFIGQGLGAGLRDAQNLIWKLVAVLRAELPDAALDTYQSERKPHVTSMIGLAVVVGRVMASGAAGEMARTHLWPLLGHVPVIGSAVTDSVTPRLSRSMFVARRGSRPFDLAGSLCPNCVVDHGTRIDEIAAGGFLFVAVTPLTREQRTELDRRGAAILVVPASSELGEWLRRGRASAAIVRPDKTVLAASRSISSLHTRVPSCPALSSKSTHRSSHGG